MKLGDNAGKPAKIGLPGTTSGAKPPAATPPAPPPAAAPAKVAGDDRSGVRDGKKDIDHSANAHASGLPWFKPKPKLPPKPVFVSKPMFPVATIKPGAGILSDNGAGLVSDRGGAFRRW